MIKEVEAQIELLAELGERVTRAYENLKKESQERRTRGLLIAKRREFDQYHDALEKAQTFLYNKTTAAERKTISYFIDRKYEVTHGIIMNGHVRIEEWYDKQNLPRKEPTGMAQFNDTTHIQPATRGEQLRLPRIKIEPFTGDYHKWVSFKSLFTDLVHDKQEIPTVEKFHHLIAALTGEPKKIISHYTITADNYTSAWETLLGRYDNKRILVNNEIKILLNLPKITEESAIKLKEMVDAVRESTNALENLGINIATWDPILVFIVAQKIDATTHHYWQTTITDPKALPELKHFLQFLETRFQNLEYENEGQSRATTNNRNQYSSYDRRSFSRSPRKYYQNQRNHSSNQQAYAKNRSYHQNANRSHQSNHEIHRSPRTFLINNNTSPSLKCPVCNDKHGIWRCNIFLEKNVQQRTSYVEAHRLCTNCMGNHPADECRSGSGCKHCRKRHHTLLHSSSSSNTNISTGSSSNNAFASTSTSNNDAGTASSRFLSHMATETTPHSQVLLATALVKVASSDGTMHTLRCLLDQGSQASFITQAAVQHLKLTTTSIIANIAGLGSVKSSKSKALAQINIQSTYNSFDYPVNALVISKITDHLPSSKISSISNWPHIHGLQLADPKYFIPNKIDILLGADVYANIILEGVRRGAEGEPIAQLTQLGWIISGGIQCPPANVSNNKNQPARQTLTFHHRLEIDQQLRAFWEIEEMHKPKILSKEEAECERMFYETIERDETGRFVVGLPFKSDCKPLGQSKQRALVRLKQLENKFQRNEEFCKNYSTVMQEYEELKHMKIINNHQYPSDSYYVPHHAVLKESSTTTKLRVVFDASAKTTSGVSLNEQLMVGPTLQQDLASILIRWRVHDVILSADITQMYRQIKVRSDDTRFQRILWYNKNRQINEFELQTLTFGTAPAAYLAVKTLQHLAIIEKQNHQMATDIILKDFYVDDLLTGADTVEDAITIYKEITDVLASGGFQLRKWISNKSLVLQNIPQSFREITLPLSFDIDNTTKTLGMHYHPAADQFQFKVHEMDSKKPATKRNLLSDISRLFDPLGLMAPITIKAKIFLQRLWQNGYEWDQQLSGTLKNDWQKFRAELKSIENIHINRWLGKKGHEQTIQIHGFCDASEQAFAAVVYTRFTDKNGSIKTTLVTSKTRVAPIKSISLPRLELCGAVLLSKLLKSTKQALLLEDSPTFAWTDSEIVIAWLSGQPTRWKTFVANRVVEILEHTNVTQWRHVKSPDNPADCASRGLFPAELGPHKIWWSGPAYLQAEEWSKTNNISNYSTELEKKSTICAFHTTVPDTTILDTYSSLNKLLRMVALIQRFRYNCSNPSKRQTGAFTAQQIEDASITCVLIAQKEFSTEINDLKAKRNLKNNSKIITFNPFLDEHNILRVGGRIEKAALPFNQKHPILISASSKLAKLIIYDAHVRTQHGGVQLTVSIIRKKYWILKAVNEVKKQLHNCITCHRYRRTNTSQLMAPLPQSRITINRPFANVGVDYAGPVDVRVSKGRGTKTYKGYISLFICFSTKAVHLEVVSELTTKAFLAAFNRFVGRRGLPTNVYSDNGTNFVGADRELRRLMKGTINKTDIVNAASTQGIVWHFIPARSPHFGGLWEAGIKQVKTHLIKIVKNTKLTYEELSTILIQIEASLNSRPLTALSEDPNDFSALTPGHFLIGNELLAPPTEVVTEENVSSLRKWRLLNKLHQDFWKRWNAEYITSLSRRYKWKHAEKECKKDDIVLLKEDNQPPNKWHLGRIEKIHPGNDGHVRAITVRTPSGKYERAIAKIAILPIDTAEN